MHTCRIQNTGTEGRKSFLVLESAFSIEKFINPHLMSWLISKVRNIWIFMNSKRNFLHKSRISQAGARVKVISLSILDYCVK